MRPRRLLYRTACRLATAEAALERAAPALGGSLERKIDDVPDDEAPPPHLAQHRERHLLAPGEIAQPAQLAAAKGDEHPRLALAEEVGVETEPLLELDPGPEARPSE